MSLPLGYRYAALYAGIRRDRRDDLGLIVSDVPANAAAVFTSNLVRAAPIELARRNLEQTGGIARAILINAGNANCATRTGDRVARESAKAVARGLKIRANQILPASTGVIGVELEASLITNAVPQLINELAPERFEDVARAMMTTDTTMKTTYREVKIRDGTVRFAGMTKGSGMIHPGLATTLGFVLSDAQIDAQHLRTLLAAAVDGSYNRISVDGDRSTNDMVAVLANGASGVKPSRKERKALSDVFCRVMEDLAQQIARDGEGARKLIVIRVVGATNEPEAVKIARAIANSPLVKTAIAGSDPNWGRILSAAGASGSGFDPRKVDIYLQEVRVCRGGVAEDFAEDEMKKKLDAAECQIRFVIRGNGAGNALFWTCDFTEGYIKINASYRT